MVHRRRAKTGRFPYSVSTEPPMHDNPPAKNTHRGRKASEDCITTDGWLIGVVVWGCIPGVHDAAVSHWPMRSVSINRSPAPRWQALKHPSSGLPKRLSHMIRKGEAVSVCLRVLKIIIKVCDWFEENGICLFQKPKDEREKKNGGKMMVWISTAHLHR